MVEVNLRTIIHAPIERCFDLSRSIEAHMLGTGHTKERAVSGVTSGLIGLGESVRWQATHFGIRQHLTAKVTAFERPAYFQDTMIEGAFRSMQHDHFFTKLGPEETEMKDRLLFAAPLPILGRIAEILVLKRYMRSFLKQRNAVLKRLAESDQWEQFLP
jgi:ligand-binding SRPBCC domain-containing protein